MTIFIFSRNSLNINDVVDTMIDCSWRGRLCRIIFQRLFNQHKDLQVLGEFIHSSHMVVAITSVISNQIYGHKILSCLTPNLCS